MRTATLTRETKETAIELSLNLEGGKTEISTGIGFFDHMLELFARHGRFGLEVKAKGDLKVDGHHTVEDIGIVLGKAIDEALGNKGGIARYGNALIPMDESLAEVVIDLSGRSYLVYDADFTQARQGDLDLELLEEFFAAVALNGRMNLHIRLRYGKNNHHKAEAIFKAFGRSLAQAVAVVADPKEIPSTKGVL